MPLPDLATRATFLVDDALPTNVRGYRLAVPRRLAASARSAPSNSVLVGGGDGGRRRPLARRTPARRPHRARPRRVRPRSRARAARKRLGSSGGTATPHPARSTSRATSVPGSTLASSGRPAARIEYVFDGHARAGQAPLERHDVDVARGQHLGQAGLRLVGRRTGRWAGRRPRAPASGRAEPPPLITNTTLGSSTSARAAPTSSSSDCEKPDVAGVHHHGLVADAQLCAGRRVARSSGRIASVSTKFGITRTLCRSAGGQLGRHVGPRGRRTAR